MAKMLRLVQNEYIKTLKKVSTKIIFVLIIVFALGLVGISKVGQKLSEMDYLYMYEEESGVDYSYEITEAEEMKYDGYQYDIEKYKFLEDNNISGESWKYGACMDVFEYMIDENGNAEYLYPDNVREASKQSIVSGDWKTFYKNVVSAMKESGMTEEMYWEYQYRIDNDIAPAETYKQQLEWQNRTIAKVADAKIMLTSMNGDSQEMTAEKQQYEDTITLGMYRLENNIEVDVAESSNIMMTETINYWTVFCSSSSLIQFIGLLIIVITGSALANEFSQGTIKFLLINPVKRWKILVSKYIMSITLGYIMILALYILSALLTMIFFGTSNLGADYLEVVDGTVHSTSGFLYVLRSYMLSSVNVVVMATLAFAISSLVRSSSLAIGISLFAMLSGNTIVTILKQGFKQDWARYLIFANTNLAAVADGTTGFSNHSMAFAVGVVAVHLAVFFLIAWDAFTKREV